ncbi:MAG: phosphoenolpyruvate carboxylase [Candidatus Bathyarchaeia archaeon]
MSVRNIPRTMSTQHPDNASLPPWVTGNIIHGEAEVDEAYFSYHDLGCMEVMWDAEGKEVDTRVVRKLLEKYGDFFRNKVLGEDVYLTYRVPNPRVEVAEQKILLESLVNIPVAYDIAVKFYQRPVSPIFEVILPFTTSGEDLIWLKKYYEKVVAGTGDICLDGSCRVEEWLGPFKPETIEVIPLIEDMKSILNIVGILQSFIKAAKPNYLRVFIARSDPALNYGLVCAVILSKLALSQLRTLEESNGISIYPILGVGTMPFRGHLSPKNFSNFIEEYRGLCTVTIQSALKYDYPKDDVKNLVAALNERLPDGESEIIECHEAEALMGVLSKFMEKYQRVVEKFAPLVNAVAAFVPPRRARKLHIGLFGYSRSMGEASLPRAIPFAGALYTLGIPPEFIGLRALEELSESEWSALENYYVNLKSDLESVSGFVSWRNIELLVEMQEYVAKTSGLSGENLRLAIANIFNDLHIAEEKLGIRLGPKNFAERRHENAVNNFLLSFFDGDCQDAQRNLLEAAKIRKCLG